MPEYWFVVDPGNDDLYAALKTALADKAGFHVIKERRTSSGSPPSGERRRAHVWEGSDVRIAERHP